MASYITRTTERSSVKLTALGDTVFCTTDLRHPDVVLALGARQFDLVEQNLQEARRVDAYTRETKVDIRDQVAKFKRLGGSVLVGPTYDEYVANPDSLTVCVTNEDVVVTVCHEAINRSQISALVSEEGMRRAFGTSVGRAGFPHGAASGYDPYTAYEGINSDNWYGYIFGPVLPRTDPCEWVHQAFYSAFGVEKALRLGVGLGGDLEQYLNPETFDDAGFAKCAAARTDLRKRFEENILAPAKLREPLSRLGTGSGKLIFVCFCRGAAILMRRLIENAGDVGLANICIVALPWPDIISVAGGETDLALYKEQTGNDITREKLNEIRQIEQFNLYSNLFVFIDKPTGKLTINKNKLTRISDVNTMKLLALIGSSSS